MTPHKILKVSVPFERSTAKSSKVKTGKGGRGGSGSAGKGELVKKEVQYSCLINVNMIKKFDVSLVAD